MAGEQDDAMCPCGGHATMDVGGAEALRVHLKQHVDTSTRSLSCVRANAARFKVDGHVAPNWASAVRHTERLLAKWQGWLTLVTDWMDAT